MGRGEGCAPIAQLRHPGGLQQIRAQVALHHPQLSERIGDRRSGGEGGDPFDVLIAADAGDGGFVAAALAQHLKFERKVLGALRGLGVAQFLDVAEPLQIFEVVRLIDEEVVRPACLPRQAGVLLGLAELLVEALLGVLDRQLDALLGTRCLRRFHLRPQRVQLFFDVFGFRRLADADQFEHRLRHDHHVPVRGRRLSDKPPATVGIGVSLPQKDLRVRKPAKGLPASLFADMVRNHDPGLPHQSQTA